MLCIISIYNYKILSMIMKKIILLTVVSFVALIARAQSFHYYPLKEVHDTINYLKLNFDKQGDYFVGRTFDEFWQIIRRDITPTKCNPRGTSPYIDPHGIMWLQGAYIECMDMSGVPADTCLVQAANVLIRFKPPYKTDMHDLFYPLPCGVTVDTRAKLLCNYVIEEIWVSTIDRRRGW